MISNMLDLTQILVNFEVALRINYSIQDVNKLVKNSRDNIESMLHLELTKDIYTLRNEVSVTTEIDAFLARVLSCLKDMALYNEVCMFSRKYRDTLADVSYLGSDKTQTLKVLKYLQDEKLYETRDSFFNSIIRAVSYIPNNNIKRLLCIMIVLESIGIKEGVAIIAQYLYLGGL